MAANTSQDLVSLDFLLYKNSLKQYLQNNAYFKDYDFEGSNINVLLDLLSYNTFQNAFYLNMVMSESFLDSAQLKSSIVSHAKELNYLPKSVTSAKANITVTFQSAGSNQPYTIPKGSQFSTLVKSNAYTFTTPEAIVCSSSNTTFQFTTDIYEGTYLSDAYVFQQTQDTQRFKITNQAVDTQSIEVRVYEDGSQYGEIYKATDTLLGLNEYSKVFFLQATDNGYYEVLFGDNIFGYKPKASSLIRIEYRVSAGDVANSARSFSCDFDPTGTGELLATPTVDTNTVAQDGTLAQTIESIRTYAPRYFATQQRAVATDDYSSLVLSKFSGVVDDVNVYGGETQEPKLYGRVIVAIKPTTGEQASDFLKQEVANYMLKYISIPTRIIVQDPEYFYCAVTSTVQYDKTLTTKTAQEISGIIKTAITQFSSNNLEKFGKDFRYSRFVNAIDNADSSIVSNDTNVLLVKRITPLIDYETSYELYFGNPVEVEGTYYGKTTPDEPVITSSHFTYVDSTTGANYVNSHIQDDTKGNLYVYTYINNKFTILNSNIGSVNYSTGKVLINKLLVSQYSEYISFYLMPQNKDILMTQKNILFIKLEDCQINIIEQLK